jgi:hypothetical protein
MPNPNFHNPMESILDIVLYTKIIQIWLILSIKKIFHLEHFDTCILNFKRQKFNKTWLHKGLLEKWFKDDNSKVHN